jgi:hypothetical protein
MPTASDSMIQESPVTIPLGRALWLYVFHPEPNLHVALFDRHTWNLIACKKPHEFAIEAVEKGWITHKEYSEIVCAIYGARW